MHSSVLSHDYRFESPTNHIDSKITSVMSKEMKKASRGVENVHKANKVNMEVSAQYLYIEQFDIKYIQYSLDTNLDATY